MPPRRKVRRTSSLPGLVSDDPTGLSAMIAHQGVHPHLGGPVVLPPSITAPILTPPPLPLPGATTTTTTNTSNTTTTTNTATAAATTTTNASSSTASSSNGPPSYSFTFTTNLTPSTFQHVDKKTSSSSTDIKSLSSSSTNIRDASAASIGGGMIGGMGIMGGMSGMGIGGGMSSGEPDSAASPANSTASNSRKRNADALDEFYTDALPAPRKSDQPAPHTRKFSAGHIPRPPNAFILFRSDLVARKAVPASLEADHSTISKIIGVCWRTLPARQRKRWEQKALEAKAAHKKQYPDYRYTPVHRKGPSRKKAKKEQKKDDARCEELAQLLLSGSTGADLEARVKKMDETNPETYQTTLSFGPPANGANGSGGGGSGTPGSSSSQQFTFVQGYPGAGVGLPAAPPSQFMHHAYDPYRTTGSTNNTLGTRRHSSAPPADNAFLDPSSSHHNNNAGAGSSSSTASTPRTPARELIANPFAIHGVVEPMMNPSPTDNTSSIPLSRIARKLPTKSTHHLQPHHFYAEQQQLAQAASASAAASASTSTSTSNGKKVKSSLAKAVRARAQGFGAPLPPSERDQLFIQSRWTDAAVSSGGGGAEPSSSSSALPTNGAGEKKKKKVKGAMGIPSNLLLPTWDVNAPHKANKAGGAASSTTNNNNNETSCESPSFMHHANESTTSLVGYAGSPVLAAPEYVSAEQYSPSFAPAYTIDEKYGHFDPTDPMAATMAAQHAHAHAQAHAHAAAAAAAANAGFDPTTGALLTPGLMGHPGGDPGTFDLLTYQDYGLPGFEGEALDGLLGDLGSSLGGAFGHHGHGHPGPGGAIPVGATGFDFAEQFGNLGVDTGNDDFGYQYYGQADIGSGPGSVNSTSPHTSDADDVAAYHPYDIPAPLTMAAQDPLAGYSPQGVPQSTQAHHMAQASTSSSYLPLETPAGPGGMMYGAAPDWSAFEQSTTTNSGVSAHAVAVADPIDPLDTSVISPTSVQQKQSPVVQPRQQQQQQGNQQAASFYDYRSAPASEVGDFGDYQDVHLSPHLGPTTVYPTTMSPQTATNGNNNNNPSSQPMPLRLNMQYAPTVGPYSAAPLSAGGNGMTDYGYPPSTATSPMTEQMAHFSAGPVPPHPATPVTMGMPSHPMHMHTHSQGHHMSHHPQLQQHHHQHQQQQQQHPMMVATPGVYHTHHASHSMDSFQEMAMQGQQGTGAAESWGEWTHPNPFASDGASPGTAVVTAGGPGEPLTSSGGGPGNALDPLAPRHVVLGTAYHGV